MSDPGISIREFLEAQIGSLRDLVIARTDGLSSENKQIMAKQDTTNGRVRAAEKAIAVLQVGYAVGAFIAAAAFYYVLGKP